MSEQLKVSTGQCSDKGVKAINQDFHASSTQTGIARPQVRTEV